MESVEGEGLRKYGESKEGTWTPQLAVARKLGVLLHRHRLWVTGEV